MNSQVANTPSAAPNGDDDTSAKSSELAALSAAYGLPAPIESYFDARDGTAIRYAHWRTSAKRRQGSVLHLSGRTEFIEKTIETYAVLSQSGLDVWTLDWRGQGLSGRPLTDPDKGHVTDYQKFLDDLDQFVNEITDLPASEGKTIMLAHSMGGHIGLRYLHDRPGLIDKAVFSAPMFDLSVNNAPVRFINAAVTRLGYSEHYAIGTKPFRFVFNAPHDASDNGRIEDYRARIDRFKILTHDARRFMAIQGMIRRNPGLALGGPTAGWLDATFQSLNLTWSEGYAEAIQTPLLIIGGGRDEVVVTKRQKEMAKRLPNGQFRVFDNAAHELLIECDDVRLAFLRAFGDFTGCSLNLPEPDMSHCIREG
jgi:lysophospholipase